MVAKFKIGDTVRCISILEHPIHRIGTGDELAGVYGYGWKKNKSFKIIKISNLDGCAGTKGKEPIYFYHDIDGYYGVYEEALELVPKVIEVYGIVKFLDNINKGEYK